MRYLESLFQMSINAWASARALRSGWLRRRFLAALRAHFVEPRCNLGRGKSNPFAWRTSSVHRSGRPRWVEHPPVSTEIHSTGGDAAQTPCPDCEVRSSARWQGALCGEILDGRGPPIRVPRPDAHDSRFGEFNGETPTKTLGQLRLVFSGRLLTVRWTETSETDDGGPRVFF